MILFHFFSLQLATMDGNSTSLIVISTLTTRADGSMPETVARTSVQISLKSQAEMCRILCSALDYQQIRSLLTSGLVYISKQFKTQNRLFGQMDHFLVTLLSGLEVNPSKVRTFVWKCFIVIIMDDGGLVNAHRPHQNTAPTCARKVCLVAFYL